MTIDIRKARNVDVCRLTDIALAAKRSNGYDDAFMAACREELTVHVAMLDRAEHWVAVDQEIVGFAALEVDKANPAHAEVIAFFIDPAWQRRGIGAALWRQLHQRAVQLGIGSLYLHADPNAVPFYREMSPFPG